MIGKLIIQGKAWGEFESAKRSKGNIEISGYRSYGGTHTVRMVDQPQLNKNQQIVLEWLKLQAPTAKPMQVIFWMMNNAAWGKLDELRKPIMHLTDKQQAQVLEEFGKWAQEQEEE
ncbi:hypothetical protein [Enterococcus sp. ARL09-542]|uniref:hypothetical protein n=1 Tax=Enterococcus sp. ARL09-542 TaxID=2233534 RepID=UPI001580AEA5|nr:hypothetical protein [Enterococcus sp. ARL09-542]